MTDYFTFNCSAVIPILYNYSPDWHQGLFTFNRSAITSTHYSHLKKICEKIRLIRLIRVPIYYNIFKQTGVGMRLITPVGVNFPVVSSILKATTVLEF